MKFVSRYRELLKVPQPDIERVEVREALDGAVFLLAKELDRVPVNIDVRPETLELQADPQLPDQVLVNLMKNAAQAMESVSTPELRLSGRLEYGRTILKVTDNGPGIPDELRDQIFVPFFTTKRNGSGIGLSLCRQIMTAHRGEIAVECDASGTTVRLLF